MTGVIINFPAFAGDDVRPYELRALVKAIEHRFQGLEQETTVSIGGEELSLTDLDARYAAASHEHTESEISDLQTYLTTLNDQSIFNLSDVSGTPSNNDILVWNDSDGEFQLTQFTTSGSALDSLTDVHVPSPTDGDVLTYNDTNGRWEASATSGVGVTVDGEQDITGEKTFLADQFMGLNDAGLGLSSSLWWGEELRRLEMYNDATATTGGFWMDFETSHLEPSVRIGVNSVTKFQFQTDAGQHIYDGLYLRIYDSGDTDWAEFSHDGTDFNTAFTNTTEWNITGITAIDFAGALTSITAIPEAVVTAHQAALAITESQITDLDHYTDADANAAIDARVTKSFVDALDVDADTLDSLDSAAFAQLASSPTFTGSTIALDSSSASTLAFRFDGQDADDVWDVEVRSGVFNIRPRTDALALNEIAISLSRNTAAEVTSIAFVGDSVTANGSEVATHATDAASLASGAATDGHVLTADGLGGAAWEAASGGSGSLPADPDVDSILFWDDSATGSEPTWITELDDSFLSDNVPLLDAPNVFTDAVPITLSGTAPRLYFDETDAAADGGQWRIIASGDMFFQGRSDDDLSGVNAVVIRRSGLTITKIELAATDLTFTGDVTIDGAGNELTLTNTTGNPKLKFKEQDAGTDEKIWDVVAVGGRLRFRFLNDLDSSSVDWMYVDRTGTTGDQIVISPPMVLSATGDASLSSTGHGLQIGSSTSSNLAMDTNEIMARNNGAASSLFLNNDGGLVTVGSGGITSNGDINIADNSHLILNSNAANEVLIEFATERPWTLIQAGTGASSQLRLLSQPGNPKTFSVLGDGGSFVMATSTGDMTVSGNITANSDLRLKEDLQPIPDAVHKILRLNGYTYRRTDSLFDRRFTGIVAQELEPILPEAVIDNEDGFKSIAYGNCFGLTVEAFKGMYHEFDARLKALEAKL